MNVEEIQKINELSKQLLSHGVVETPSEAVIRAEEMMKQPSEKAKEASQKEDEISYLKETIRSLTSDVRQMSEAIINLNDIHIKLKEQVDELAKKQAEDKPVAPLETTAASDTSGSDTPSETNAETSETNENQDNPFSEKDIALDKIFYFGD